jgi:preprotein translocase subunit Sec61beta
MVDPATIINPPKQPLLSPRRVVIALILVAAVLVLVVTWRGTQSGDGGGTGCANPAVVKWDACPGARILRQAQVGVELKTGFDGRITVNGIAVPESQMQGAIAPGSDAYEQLSPEERALGPRPNNKNVVSFQPGDGKVVEEFSGQVRVGIRYWEESAGEDTAQTLNYTVFVT